MPETSIAPVSTIPCNLCGGTTIEILASRDRNGRPLQTVICRDCGLAWTDPRPSAGETREFYSEKYRRQYKSTIQPKMKHVYRDVNRAITRFNRIQPLLAPGMSVLDVGAGGGFFPYVVKQNGFTVTGLEPNTGYARYAREEFQLDITTGFIQDNAFEENSFDIITLNHVLEHLEDPYAALSRLYSWLRPGGYLNVEVPNIEATYHAPRKKFHLAHLYSFNPDNLQLLGGKAGFTVSDLKIVPGTKHINILFNKPKQPQSVNRPPASCAIPGNYQRIKNIFAAHTTRAHYLSPAPYLRLLRKTAAYLKERVAVSRFDRGREVADYLMSRQLRQ